MASMAAVVHYALEKGAVDFREVPQPGDPGENEVLLKTEAVGVCGSEVHQFHNTHSWAVNVPVILGHEFCGVVAKAGGGVRAFREGDRVASETAARICGECAYCRAGEYNLCPERLGFGYGVDGAMADYVRVPARCLHPLPGSVSAEKAALTEPCCVAYNAVAVKTRIEPGAAVLVLGPGPIGLLSMAVAKAAGAGWLAVAGLERDRPRLELAARLGAHRTFSGGRDELLEGIRAHGDGLGVDVVIDASGSSAVMALALDAVRPAGQITKVGWGPQPLGISLDPLVRKAVTLRGSFSHNYGIWERVISLLASGGLDPLPLVGRVEPLQGWRACFDDMGDGRIVKGVLKPA
jgi:L-iditol 2-dehydrogenase